MYKLVLAVMGVSFVAERVVLGRAPEMFRSLAFSHGKPLAFPLPEAAKQRLLTVGDEGPQGYRALPLVHVDWSSIDGNALEGALTNESVIARFFPERGLLTLVPALPWWRNGGSWVIFHELRVIDGSLFIAQRLYVGDFLWLVFFGALALRFQPRYIMLVVVFTLIRGLRTYFRLKGLSASVRTRVAAIVSATCER